MSDYNPVNPRTLASVNRVNKRIADGINPQFAEGTAKITHYYTGNGTEPCRLCNLPKSAGVHLKSSKDSDLQEPQDPGESNDTVNPREPHKFVEGVEGEGTNSPCDICGKNAGNIIHRV